MLRKRMKAFHALSGQSEDLEPPLTVLNEAQGVCGLAADLQRPSLSRLARLEAYIYHLPVNRKDVKARCPSLCGHLVRARLLRREKRQGSLPSAFQKLPTRSVAGQLPHVQIRSRTTWRANHFMKCGLQKVTLAEVSKLGKPFAAWNDPKCGELGRFCRPTGFVSFLLRPRRLCGWHVFPVLQLYLPRHGRRSRSCRGCCTTNPTTWTCLARAMVDPDAVSMRMAGKRTVCV